MNDYITANTPGVRWILWGIPVIIIFGSVMHFVYDWSGNLAFIGILAPINESVWEHLKLTFWPTLLWWFWGYFQIKRNAVHFLAQWFFPCITSLVIAPIFIVSFYYTYTGALGIHSLLLDISSLFIGVIIAQLSALHIYRYARLGRCSIYLPFAVIIFLIGVFIIFTFDPPHLPVFRDSQTGLYGI